MAVLKINNVGDTTGSVNPITLSSIGATTATWPSAPANMPTVASPDILKLVVEPGTPNEEILYVTAFTAGASSATVTRAQEGSAARAHSATPWAHGSTAADFSPMTLVGDMEMGGANGALTRLPIGAAGTVLTPSSGSPSWGQVPAPAILGANSGATTATVPGFWVTGDTVTLTPGNWLVQGVVGIAIQPGVSGFCQALVTTSTGGFVWGSTSGSQAAQQISPWDYYLAGTIQKAFYVWATIAVNVNTPIYLAIQNNYSGSTAPTLSGGYNTFQHGLVAIFLGHY